MSLFGNSVLAGSAGQGPSADLGDAIDQSLRFRGSQRLKRTLSSTSNRKTFTYSFWLKLTVDGVQSSDTIWQNGDTSGNNLFSFQWLPSPSWGDFFRVDNYTSGNQVNLNTSGTAFRDPSAWYHVVLAVDTTQAAQADRVVLYVNNQEITWGGGNTYPSQNFDTNVNVSGRDIAIGSTTVSSGWFNGYLASFQFIDGTALSPTDFGKYNEDGVWVPQDYTGTYGTNGFHLTFDSSQTNGIGHDSSGQNNHFSASGFDTATIGIFSNDLFTAPNGTTTFDYTTTAKSFLSAATSGFNNDNTSFVFANVNNSLLFRPTTPLTGVTQLEMFTDGNSNYVFAVNSQEVSLNSSTPLGTTGYKQVVLPSGFNGTLNNFGIRNSASGGAAGFGSIRINGTPTNGLVDNTDNDVDFFDTPTSNYSTYNPLVVTTGATGTFSNANLGNSAGSNWYTAMPTVKLGETEKWYAEFDFKTNYHASSVYGMIAVNTKTTDGGFSNRLNPGFGVGMSGDSGYKDGSLYVSGGQFAPDFRTTGGYMMWAYDAATRNVWIGKDGTWYNSGDPANGTNPTITLTAGNEYILSISSFGSTVGFANFGQMPFIYTVPTGFSALQTNNLPEPTIKNGKEHFDVVTYSGTGSAKSETGLEFQPDFIWIKERGSTSESHILVDSVRGSTSTLRSNSSHYVVTSSNYITSFDANGFSVGTDSGTNDSSGTYVAWCWKAGESFTPSQTGGITNLAGSRNTDAGFSIVSYTGSNSAATIGHGLSSPPEMIIIKNRDDIANWIVYHKYVHPTAPEDYYLMLHVTDARTGDPDGFVFNGTAPTSSVFHVGAFNNTNGSGDDLIAYCWHSVPGYSAFGSYTGNSDNNGPFVYLGFRPAFLLVKRVTEFAEDWIIVDSTRSPNNPCAQNLFPNRNGGENSNIGTAWVDLLSNGFKLRASIGPFNGGSTYIYAAFAENPFGGENAPPATAR